MTIEVTIKKDALVYLYCYIDDSIFVERERYIRHLKGKWRHGEPGDDELRVHLTYEEYILLGDTED